MNSEQQTRLRSPVFLQGGGEMGELTRAYNWSETPLGNPEHWPLNLQLSISIVLSSKFPMFLWWGKDLIQFYNDAYRPSLGIEGKHPVALGQKAVDCWPEIWDFIEPLITKVMTTGEASWYESQYLPIFRNGRLEDVYWTFSYSPVRNEAGGSDGVLVVCHETTRIEQAMQDVKRSEEQMRSMVQSAPFPIAVYIGRDMRISMANSAIIDLWGKGKDVIGKLYAELMPELRDQDIFRQMDRVYESGVPFHAKNQRVQVQHNGRMQDFYFNYSITPLFNSTGEVYGVMSTAADVTDLNIIRQKLELSEQNLRNTILQAPVAMCLLRGPAHIIEIANDRMYELWGKPAELLQGRPIFSSLPEAAQQGFEDLLEKVFTTGETVSAQEVLVHLPREEGIRDVYINFLYTPYRDTDGSVSGVLAVAIDVTDTVMAKNKIEVVVAQRTSELAEANLNLQKSNAELEQFAYIASHDLQEPLRKISIFAQMLSSSLNNLEERPRNYLQKIGSASARMTTLIRDLLAYSQVSKESAAFGRVDLNRVVEATKNDFEVLIEQQGAVIENDRLPTIEAIPMQMSQLFANLISNSIKYARKNEPPHIRITAGRLSEQEAGQLGGKPGEVYHELVFRDNGIGFNPEYAEQIFHIFQRLHRKTEYAGTGIGLAICKKIAENHRGSIRASGNTNEGAIFTVVLPEAQH